MSTSPNDKQLESLKKILIPIENELIEISNMAANVSEKFQGVSRDIESLSGVIGLLAGQKAGVITSLAAGLFSIIGEIRAEKEKEKALMELLSKKQELAKLKIGLITSFRDNINNKIEPLSLLLTEEVKRPYDETNRTEYEALYGNSCIDAFDLYVVTYYLVQLCDFMLLEFNAWNEGKHESGHQSPDKSFALYVVLHEIIIPNGVISKGSYAGIWLLSERQSILAGSMYKKYLEGEKIDDDKGKGFYSDSYKKTRVVKKESFKALKTYVNEIKKIASEDKTDNLNVLINSSIYKQAKSYCNIRSPRKYFFNVAFLILLPVILILIFKEKSFDSGMACVALAIIYSLVGQFWLWQKNVKSTETGCFSSLIELFIKVVIVLISGGTIPLLAYLYEKKEDNYEVFVNNLKTYHLN